MRMLTDPVGSFSRLQSITAPCMHAGTAELKHSQLEWERQALGGRIRSHATRQSFPSLQLLCPALSAINEDYPNSSLHLAVDFLVEQPSETEFAWLRVQVTVAMASSQVPPGTDLCALPAAVPPDGQLPNFASPDSLTTTTVVIGVLMAVWSLAFVAARVIVSWRRLSWSDCGFNCSGTYRYLHDSRKMILIRSDFMVIGTIFNVASTVVFIYSNLVHSATYSFQRS